jgi:hypothetical protein
MRATLESVAGSADKPSEDWAAVVSGLAVVLDGGTARTETGCVHGVAWFAHQLGAAVVANAASPAPLSECLAFAIASVAGLHPECDLTHPGTPSAAVGIIRATPETLEYLVLGDITVDSWTPNGNTNNTDDRVSHTAQPARRKAELLPIGSPEKAAALLEMKAGELAARNRPGGYWVSAADPNAVLEAKTGSLPVSDVLGVAVLSDGAARAADDFRLMSWPDVLALLGSEDPTELIRRVRAAENSDPLGQRWPRNKACDDATAVYMDIRSTADRTEEV